MEVEKRKKKKNPPVAKKTTYHKTRIICAVCITIELTLDKWKACFGTIFSHEAAQTVRVIVYNGAIQSLLWKRCQAIFTTSYFEIVH